MAPKAPYACVLILGHKYTALEWFLGRGARPRERVQALAICGAHAVQLSGGNHNTLLSAGFAKAPPLRCKELWPGRRNFPSALTDTACAAVRTPSQTVQARLVCRPKCLKSMLLRAADLEECFRP